MAQSLTKEEEQLLKLYRNKDAPIKEFTALLDKGGVRLNIHDEKGFHPLWLVSKHGRSDLADLFLQYGAKVDLTTNKLGETALITASAKGHLETAKLLLHHGALVNFQQKDGTTALYFASKNNHVEVVNLLLNSGAQVNKGSQTPLYNASLRGRVNIAQILLDHGADVNQPCDEEPYSSPLETACSNNHLQVAQLLIINDADVDYQDSVCNNIYLSLSLLSLQNGRTPLHGAANFGHVEPLKLLLSSHAKLNAKDNFGYTPVHYAAENGHIEVVRLLLLSQANMEIKNNAGKTPLQVAEEKKHMEIVHLLKTGVPAQPAEVSVSGEAGDGEKPGEEKEPSVEPLTGELKSTDDRSQLTATVIADYMKCPVCLNVEVDPCTLPCGHTFCQLCLARLWKVNKKICPVCKETWKVFPAISYDHRANIESTHGRKVEQIRKRYSQEDKELIEKCLKAKRTANEEKALPDPATSDAVQQLQQLAIGGKPQQGRLRINDLKKIQRTIWEARTQWYNLGLELDITPDTLDAIKQDNANKTEDCFRAMLTKWLREHQSTWSVLAEALRSPSVGRSDLAEDIAEQN